MSFRQVPTSDGEGRSAGLSLQASTVYNLILLIYNGRDQYGFSYSVTKQDIG